MRDFAKGFEQDQFRYETLKRRREFEALNDQELVAMRAVDDVRRRAKRRKQGVVKAVAEKLKQDEECIAAVKANQAETCTERVLIAFDKSTAGAIRKFKKCKSRMEKMNSKQAKLDKTSDSKNLQSLESTLTVCSGPVADSTAYKRDDISQEKSKVSTLTCGEYHPRKLDFVVWNDLKKKYRKKIKLVKKAWGDVSGDQATVSDPCEISDVQSQKRVRWAFRY